MGLYRVVDVRLDKSLIFPYSYIARFSLDCKRLFYWDLISGEIVVYDLENGVEMFRRSISHILGSITDLYDFFEIPNTNILLVVGRISEYVGGGYIDRYVLNKYDYVNDILVDEKVIDGYVIASEFNVFYYNYCDNYYGRIVVPLSVIKNDTDERLVIIVSIDDLNIIDDIRVNQSYDSFISVLSKDGKYLVVSYSNSNLVEVYDVVTKNLVYSLEGDYTAIFTMSALNDANSNIVMSLWYSNVSAVMYDLKTSNKVWELNLDTNASVIEYGYLFSNIYTDPFPLIAVKGTNVMYMTICLIGLGDLEIKYMFDVGVCGGLHDSVVSLDRRKLGVAYLYYDTNTGNYYLAVNLYSIEYEYPTIEVEVVGGEVGSFAEVELTYSKDDNVFSLFDVELIYEKVDSIEDFVNVELFYSKEDAVCSLAEVEVAVEAVYSGESSIASFVEVNVTYGRVGNIPERLLDSVNEISYEASNKIFESSELWSIIVYDMLIRKLAQLLGKTKLIK